MTKYYYAPYNDSKMKAYARALVKSKNGFFNTHKLVNSLEDVGNGDRLYVMLHGGGGTLGWKEYYNETVMVTMFGGTAPMTREKHRVHLISPAELSTHLIDSGLENKKVDLRLLACYGGIVKGGQTSTAGQLKSLFNRKNRSKVTVSGYSHAVDVTPSEIARTGSKRVHVNGKLMPAKNYRVKFA